jgi:hypothetical protein
MARKATGQVVERFQREQMDTLVTDCRWRPRVGLTR